MTRRDPRRDLGRAQFIKILVDFLNGTGGDWDWDDFTQGPPLRDEGLEAIRARVAQLGQEFPAEKKGEYCNAAGRAVIRDYIGQLSNELERPE